MGLLVTGKSVGTREEDEIADQGGQRVGPGQLVTAERLDRAPRVVEAGLGEVAGAVEGLGQLGGTLFGQQLSAVELDDEL